MTPTDILALPPGPPLDAAIHQFVFGGVGELTRYSTDDREGAKLFDRMALFVGRVDGGPKFQPGRPWIAGLLAFEPAVNGYVTRMSVTAPTRLTALCKAALLVIFQPAKSSRVAPVANAPAPANSPASQQAAKELAARIGTPGARSPAAGIAAAQKAAEKKAADRAKRDEKAAKRAARVASVPYLAPRAVAQAERQPIPTRIAPRIAQPAVFTGERRQRAPMPERPKAWVAPQPIDSGGKEDAP